VIVNDQNDKINKIFQVYIKLLMKFQPLIMLLEMKKCEKKKMVKMLVLLKNIYVKIDKETGIFEISNDGHIEIVKHPEHGHLHSLNNFGIC
jgi:hypothetical protein